MAVAVAGGILLVLAIFAVFVVGFGAIGIGLSEGGPIPGLIIFGLLVVAANIVWILWLFFPHVFDALMGLLALLFTPHKKT